MSRKQNKSSPDSFKPEKYTNLGIGKTELYELKDAFDLLDAGGKGSIDPVDHILFRSSSRV